MRRFLCAVFVCIAVDVAFLGEALFSDSIRAPGDIVSHRAPYVDEVDGDPSKVHNRLLSDWAYQFRSWQHLIRVAWRDGRVPLWNELSGCGAPLLANMQCEAVSPFLPLHLLVDDQYPDWRQLAQMLIAQILCLFLARHLGLSAAAGCLIALTYSFHSYLQTWAVHPHSAGAAFAPGFLHALLALRQSGSARAMAAAAVALAASVLSGHIETAFKIGMTAAFVATLARPETRIPFARFLLRFVATTLLGLALSAVLFLPFLDYLDESVVTRARLMKPHASLETKHLIGLLHPAAMGHPPLHEAPHRIGPNFFSTVFFYGRLALLLSLIGAIAGMVRRRSPTMPLLVTAGIGFFVAYAPASVGEIVQGIPPFDRTPIVRMTFVAALPLAVLAGFGLDAVLRRLRSPKARTCVVIVVTAITITEAFVQWYDFVPTTERTAYEPKSRIIDELAHRIGNDRAFPATRHLAPESNAFASIASIRTYDAVGHERHGLMMISNRVHAPLVSQKAASFDERALDMMSVRWLLTDWPADTAVRTANGVVVTSETPFSWDFETWDGPLELLLARGPGLPVRDETVTVRLTPRAAADGKRAGNEKIDDETPFATSKELLFRPGASNASSTSSQTNGIGRLAFDRDAALHDFLAYRFLRIDVDYVRFRAERPGRPMTISVDVTDGAPPVRAWVIHRDGFGSGLEERFKLGRVRITERPTALPRAYRAPKVRQIDEFIEFMNVLRDPRFDPRRETILEPIGGNDLPDDIAFAPQATADGIDYERPRPEVIRLRVDHPTRSLVVVNEVAARGWTARIDGRPTQIHPANLVASAIVVPAGEHVVELRYEPLSFFWGAITSAVAALVVVGMLIFGKKSPRRSEPKVDDIEINRPST